MSIVVMRDISYFQASNMWLIWLFFFYYESKLRPTVCVKSLKDFLGLRNTLKELIIHEHIQEQRRAVPASDILVDTTHVF